MFDVQAKGGLFRSDEARYTFNGGFNIIENQNRNGVKLEAHSVGPDLRANTVDCCLIIRMLDEYDT